MASAANRDMLALRDEVERAAKHYYHSPQQLGIDRRTKQFVVERCLPFVRGPKVLDLGYVDGQWADALLAQGCQIDIVEGAARHTEHARHRYAGNRAVRVYHCLFQEYAPDTRYDTVVAGDMLRYLPDPAAFLRQARGWMNDDGRLIATLPNSRSLHRRIGALMNLESTPVQANQRDQEVGNHRGYDRYEFRHLLLEGGLEIEMLRSCFLKPLSSAQMEGFSDQLLRAFLDVGDELEDYCWFLYAICRRGGS
jgi:2-polyprenyl-3-methyl-5-hydroxy-6-metoxy-1,4-benzoquinol methylase